MRLITILLAALAAAPWVSAGESRTLTAQDGRTIEAEIIGFRGENLRVRRADNNREFELSIASLNEADQRATRNFIRDHPDLRDVIKPTDVRVEFSRGKFEREVTSDTSWRDSSVESWGYTIAVLNQARQPLEGLRLDYIVFARRDPDNVSYTAKVNGSAPLQSTPGSETLATIAPGQRVSFRTKAVTVTRTKYTDGTRLVAADGKLHTNWRDREVYGVWYRLYDGDKLVLEDGAPDSLRKTERWEKP